MRQAPPVNAELPPRQCCGATSSISTRAPPSRADNAAQVAALPAPTTITSNFSPPAGSITRSLSIVEAVTASPVAPVLRRTILPLSDRRGDLYGREMKPARPLDAAVGHRFK